MAHISRYKKPEQALRMGAWYCCTGYVSIVSPLINYGLGHITTGSLHPWQYVNYRFDFSLPFTDSRTGTCIWLLAD